MTLVIAHRGASWDFPENTLPAFERAIEIGADYVELDVHVTRSGDLVVTHDPPSNRLLQGRSVPRLEEVLDLCRGRIGVMVELKTPYRYRRHDVVRRTLALLDDDAVIVCFEPGAIAVVRELRPRVRTVQHVAFVPMRVAAALRCWAVGIENARATPRAIARAQRLNLETTVYTVNDAERMRELARLGVTGIFSDRPDLALQTLRG
jgi:glycerophosphoryl diester phosphodiesterase